MSDDKYDDHIDQDDEYLDDDFSDESSDDGDWSDEEDQTSDEPVKKKSSKSNLIIIGVAVIAGLLFMVYKFGGSKSTELPAADPNAPQVAEFSDAPAPDVAPAPVDTPPPTEQAADQPLTPMPSDAPPEQQQGGLMTGADPSLAPTATPAPDAAPAPAAEPQPIEQAAAPVDMMAPQPVPEASAPSQPEIPAPVQPVSDFPSVDLIKKAPPTSGEPTPTPAPVASVQPQPIMVDTPSPEPTPAAVVAPVTAPVAADPELQSKLDDANSKISTYEGEVSDLKDRVAELESQLARANDRAAQSAQKSSPEPVEAAAPKKVAVKKVVRVDDEAQVASAPVTWVLKGAQSGKALLAKSGQSDVTTVRVGDYVPGLGRILSIEQGNSGWVVVGTASRIQE